MTRTFVFGYNGPDKNICVPVSVTEQGAGIGRTEFGGPYTTSLFNSDQCRKDTNCDDRQIVTGSDRAVGEAFAASVNSNDTGGTN